MAHVDWSTGIDSVSGALNKNSKSSQHSCTKMLLGTHRTAETTSDSCNRLYIRKPIKRKTPPSVEEIAARDLFAERAAWVKARAKALSTLSTDQANYLAQKDSADGAKTWKSYLWKLAKAAVTGEGE